MPVPVPVPVPVPPAAKPNLLLITVDTLRADHLACYGYFRDTAPHIDALARESIVFDNCLAPLPRTTPSHLSLMAGVYPLEHGITSNGARASELFDLQDDPFELHDVRAENPEVAQELRTALLTSMSEQRESGRRYGVQGAPPEKELDAEHLEQLRALGYVDDER